MTRTGTDGLVKRIEQLVQEHIAASHQAAQDALQRAFASSLAPGLKTMRPVRRTVTGKRRDAAEMAVMCERLYEAVSAQPGALMTAHCSQLGVSVRELQLPMAQLKQKGKVRSVGQRSLMRYFPMNRSASAG